MSVSGGVTLLFVKRCVDRGGDKCRKRILLGGKPWCAVRVEVTTHERRNACKLAIKSAVSSLIRLKYNDNY